MFGGDLLKEKIGGVSLNYEYYSGKDLYSDGMIEDVLLDIVKNNSKDKYDHIIYEKSEWPILYHLSPVRENIIEWIPFKENAKVLEIGSGCGAITGKLAEKSGNVTCVELSKKRSLINAYRNKEKNNIEIMVGNFQDIEKNLDDDYDYILLIGVLEYAASYIKSNSPYREFLDIIKKHLSTNGKIIVAIENKYGLKYWAGCKEDHVSLFYEGIEDYIHTNSVRTFSKKELISLHESCGLNIQAFYYPYPDYKLPLQIFSDEYLPKCGDLTNNLLALDNDRIVSFDESRVYDSLIRDGMFQDFSNSFLIISGMEEL
jgi:SAM-dependent methyltransferase